MPAIKARREDSYLVVVDVQPNFMRNVWEAERVVRRSEFLLRAAQILGVPSVATEQNPERMGPTNDRLTSLVDCGVHSKMSFSCCGCKSFLQALPQGRRQAVIVGVETHICVSQTAIDLLNLGHEVIVCPDSVSARSVEMHKIGMERMRDSGVLPMHSESVVYEWMNSADDPAFRDVLAIVKEFAA